MLAGGTSGEEAHVECSLSEAAAAGGTAHERVGHAEDALPCSLAEWLEPAHARTLDAAEAEAVGSDQEFDDAGGTVLANGVGGDSQILAVQQAGSLENTAAPAEASAPALEPGLGGSSGRAAASVADAQSSRGGEASCSGRGAGGGDAPLLMHFTEKVRWCRHALTCCWAAVSKGPVWTSSGMPITLRRPACPQVSALLA